MSLTLECERFILRPLEAADAKTVQAFCNNWNIACMLARVPHPYPDGYAETWIATHPALRAEGAGSVFGIDYEGQLVGSVGVERKPEGNFELGYWLGEPWWGRGLMTEAARRTIGFAFESLEIDRLTSSYFDDNPASGRVLEKCGFRDVGPTGIWCEARSREMPSRALELSRAAAEALQGGARASA